MRVDAPFRGGGYRFIYAIWIAKLNAEKQKALSIAEGSFN